MTLAVEMLPIEFSLKCLHFFQLENYPQKIKKEAAAIVSQACSLLWLRENLVFLQSCATQNILAVPIPSVLPFFLLIANSAEWVAI